jgi:hypothetical protein
MSESPTKNYRVSFLMRAADARALVDLIRDDVSELKVEEVGIVAIQPPPPPSNGVPEDRRPMSRRRSQGRAAQLVYTSMKPGVSYRTTDFVEIMEGAGYKPSTAGPSLGDLELDGLIKRVGRSTWVRPVETSTEGLGL